MTRLGDTVAELLARASAVPATSGASAHGGLSPVADFGANPGALRMWLHMPEAPPEKAPLVVVLHGCGQTAAGYAAGAGWLELAERYGFGLLCAEQTRGNNANLCFNWFEDEDARRGLGEAASIAQMVRHALAGFNLDPRRVFVTGLSAGGAMTAVMLANYPEVFAGGAIIAGLPYGAASGVGQALGAMRRIPDLPAKSWGDQVRAAAPAPVSWPRVSIWHGGADAMVTPAAGEALALQWRDVHRTEEATAEPTTASGHTHTTWRGPSGDVSVELHRLGGLAHGTPIAAGGPDGCGTPAPWILEAGVSSTLEIARSWGLAGVRRSIGRDLPPAEPARPTEPGLTSRPFDDTITRALRGAGLLR